MDTGLVSVCFPLVVRLAYLLVAALPACEGALITSKLHEPSLIELDTRVAYISIGLSSISVGQWNTASYLAMDFPVISGSLHLDEPEADFQHG